MGNNITSAGHLQSGKSENCNIYTSFKRKQNSSFLGIKGYEGIPQNLILNILGWVILHILFIFLRKKAWNYGRIALMQKEEIKWTDMFYGVYPDEDEVSSGSGSFTNRPPLIMTSAISAGPGNENFPVVSHSPMETTPATTSSPPPPPKRDPEPPAIKLVKSPRDQTTQREKNEAPGAPAGDGENSKKNNDVVNNAQTSDQDGPTNPPSLQKILVREIRDTGYFSWIKIVFNLTDDQYRDKCGQDVVFYMSFQRHLIVLAAIITLCSLLIILPINLHQSFRTDKPAEFSDTTIINLTNNHNYLWAHILLSIAYLFVSIAVMRHFSRRLQFTDEDDSDVSRTIIIIGIRKNSKEIELRDHFAEGYPGSEINEVSFAYDISNLQWYEFKRLSAASARIYFQEALGKVLAIRAAAAERRKSSKKKSSIRLMEFRPKMRPYVCGVCGCCCRSCGRCKETDAIEYYTEKEKEYTEMVDIERQKAIKRPLGIAFVTFSSLESAERVVEDYACSARLFLHTPVSKYTKELNSNRWVVKYAPPPEDINWENLTLDFKWWYMKFIVINLILAVIVIVFTTPVYLFKTISDLQLSWSKVNQTLGRTMGENLQLQKQQTTPLTGVIVDTLPTVIIWVIGVTMISIVARSDMIIGFWTKTAANLSEMIKIFFFLTFMVIVLPSLGVTSFSYFFLEKKKDTDKLTWSCIFYKENGALFVNYICTSSLVGTAAELMRLPELFIYAIKLGFARSKAEIGSIRKSVLWDFQIGSSYAWMMLHFALFTCFSVIYPLVTPFGLLYLCLKYWTDRYNIYFAYAPCKVNKDVHGTAVNFVIMCMFMLQINLLAYVHFHLGQSAMESHSKSNMSPDPEIRALQVFSLLGFSITAALFLGQLCFNVCADFSPIQHFKSVSHDGQIVLPDGNQNSSEDVEQTVIPEHPLRSNESTTRLHEQMQKQKQGQPQTRVPEAPGGKVEKGGGGTPEIQVTEVPSGSSTGSQKQNDNDNRSNSLGSSHSAGKPYGRYIPPLLRPEFVKLLARRQN